uniref:Maestro/Maestro-like HEAT-repeats domain-containing protein n=1 Tax=Salvator merianae TaxID=96440 RepID=A0A8D0DJ66_SALMN
GHQTTVCPPLVCLTGQGGRIPLPFIPLFLPSSAQLLHYQDIEHLPSDQIFESLEQWSRSPHPNVRSLSLRALGILAIHPDKVRKQTLWFCFQPRSSGQANALGVCSSQADTKVRNSAIGLFAELPNVVKKKEKYLIQEQVTQSLVPLLLHLQDEEPDVAKVSAARDPCRQRCFAESSRSPRCPGVQKEAGRNPFFTWCAAFSVVLQFHHANSRVRGI